MFSLCRWSIISKFEVIGIKFIINLEISHKFCPPARSSYNKFMPTYTFACQDCRKRFAVFLSYTEYDTATVVCPHCQSQKVSRHLGRVRFTRGGESSLDNLDDPAQYAGLEDDPKAMARMMRQMSSELGEHPGPEFDEVINRLEQGQSPEEIEKDLPDLGSSLSDEDL